MAKQVKLGAFLTKGAGESKGTEVKAGGKGLFELPEGWKWVRLREISEKPQYGYTAPAQDKPIGPKMLRITDIQDGKVNWDSVPYCEIDYKEFEKYRIEKGDILFARTGATTGKTFLVEKCPEAVFASYLIRLKVSKEGALPEFIYAFFQSPQYWEQIKPRGGAQPNMNAKILSNLQIPLAPFEEQRRIVAHVEELVGRVEEAKRLRRIAREEAEKIMQAALHKVFSKAEEEWELTKLVKVCKINPSKSEIRDLPDDLQVTFVPMVAVSEITGRIERPEVMLLGEVRKGYTYFREDDVLFAKITPCMENGKSAIARNLVNGIGFGSTEFHILRAMGEVMPEWLYHYIRQKSFRDEASKYMTGSVGQQRVPVQFLKNIKIPLPPVYEQKRMIAYLDKTKETVESLKVLQQRTEEELEKLVPAILDRAFKGEL